VTATDARVWFGSGGVVQVESFLRLTDRSYLYCHTYDDRPPILAVDDAHVKVSFAVPDASHVTGQDLAMARKLADTAARYVAELERFAAQDAAQAAGADEPGRQAA
jgi:hypothetical protein